MHTYRNRNPSTLLISVKTGVGNSRTVPYHCKGGTTKVFSTMMLIVISWFVLSGILVCSSASNL